ncbi:pilus assembly protein PilM [Candidatus Omnitrophota bacterium]
MKIDSIFNTFRVKLDALVKDKVDSIVVVDIGSKLTLVNVELKGRLEVTALKIVELEVKKRNEIVLNSLRDFIQENGILSKFAVLSPSLDSLLIKRIRLPAVPDNELKEAIKWQLREDISFDLSEAVLDFSTIKKTTKDDGSKVLDIICAVAQEQEIKLQVMPLKQSGLTCLAVGLLPFGYEELVARYLEPEKNDSIAVIHLSDNICCFNIYVDNKLAFYRELPITVDQFKSSLRGALVSDKGKIELNQDEAEEVLFTIGVPEPDANYKDKMNSTQILSMLRPMLERLAAEIKRSLTYYETHFQGGEVKSIVIFGRGVGINNLDDFLRKETSLNIKKASLNDKIQISSEVDPVVFSRNYASLGLALNYKGGINLLPHEFRAEKIEKLQTISLRWTTFIVFLLLVVSFVFAKAGVGFYQQRLDNANLHLNFLSEVVQLKTKIDQMNNFVVEVRNSEIPIGSMLKSLSNIAPRELFIVDFSLDCDSKGGTLSGFIKDFGKNPNAILTKFITGMKKTAYFSDSGIVSVAKSENGTTEFKINFTLF